MGYQILNKYKEVEYVSYGGGSPSLALIILNLKKQIKPITDRNQIDEIIFADTGWERTDIINQTKEIKKYVESFGFKFTIVQSELGTLENYLESQIKDDAFIPIPYHSKNKGIGQRQCTSQFKIRPIHKYLRKTYGPISRIAQLGIHYDEFERVKDPQTKRDVNRFPLVDLKLRRADCVKIVEEEGLPIPPKSACVGCPYLPASRFISLSKDIPSDFERAEKIDSQLNKKKKYLSRTMIPLSSLKNQIQFDDMGEHYSCESGYCFT